MNAPSAGALAAALATETKATTERAEQSLHDPGLAQTLRDGFAKGIIRRVMRMQPPVIPGYLVKMDKWADAIGVRVRQLTNTQPLQFPSVALVLQVQAVELDKLNNNSSASQPQALPAAAPPSQVRRSLFPASNLASFGAAAVPAGGAAAAPAPPEFKFDFSQPFSFGSQTGFQGALEIGGGRAPIADITDTPQQESADLMLAGYDSVGEALVRALGALRKHREGEDRLSCARLLIGMHRDKTPLAEIIAWVWAASVGRSQASNNGEPQSRACDLLPALEYYAYCRTQRVCDYTVTGSAVCVPSMSESVSHVLLLCVACLCLVTGWCDAGDEDSSVREAKRHALVACLKQVDKGSLIVLDMFIHGSSAFDVIDVLAHRVLHALSAHAVEMIGSPISVYMDSLFPTEFHEDMQRFLRCEAVAHAVVAQRSDRYNHDDYFRQYQLHWYLYQEMRALGAADKIIDALAAGQQALVKAPVSSDAAAAPPVGVVAAEAAVVA